MILYSITVRPMCMRVIYTCGDETIRALELKVCVFSVFIVAKIFDITCSIRVNHLIVALANPADDIFWKS